MFFDTHVSLVVFRRPFGKQGRTASFCETYNPTVHIVFEVQNAMLPLKPSTSELKMEERKVWGPFLQCQNIH